MMRDYPVHPKGLHRRSLLCGSVAAAAAAVSASVGVGEAGAATPPTGRQLPAVHRVKIGSHEVTALSDGYLDLPANFLQGSDWQPDAWPGSHLTPLNVFAVNTGDKLYLVDAGMGSARGPNLGHLVPSLKAVGIAPEDVDAILVTHLHVDHIAGLVKGDGSAVFPRAEVVVPEVDADFWLDPGLMARAREVMKPSIQYAVAATKAYEGRFTRFKPGNSAAPGIESILLPGHTPGHTGFFVGTGSERLLFWGDIVSFTPFQFSRPDLATLSDIDGTLGAATRKRVCDMAVADRLLIAGPHHPFPGLGRLGRKGSEFVYLQEPWRPSI